MNIQRIVMTYLVVANDRRLDAINPTEALVWKKELEVIGVDLFVNPDPDWCYERILEANPDFEDYTIAIWAVDVTLE